MITNYLTELSNGEEIMTTMEPPTLFEGEETEPQSTTEEYEVIHRCQTEILPSPEFETVQNANVPLSFI